MALPKRKNLRLQNYNYASNGYYFITICSYHGDHLFGNIPIDTVGQGLCSCRLSDTGKMIENKILKMPLRNPNIKIDLCQIIFICFLILTEDGKSRALALQSVMVYELYSAFVYTANISLEIYL